MWPNAVFFNRGSGEPQGSKWLLGVPPKQTEIALDKICNHTSMRLEQYRHLDHCIAGAQTGGRHLGHMSSRKFQNVALQF